MKYSGHYKIKICFCKSTLQLFNVIVIVLTQLETRECWRHVVRESIKLQLFLIKSKSRYINFKVYPALFFQGFPLGRASIQGTCSQGTHVQAKKYAFLPYLFPFEHHLLLVSWRQKTRISQTRYLSVYFYEANLFWYVY